MAPLDGNGKWTIANITFTAMLLMFAGVVGWMLDSVISLREFAAAGDRFTAGHAREMEMRLREEMVPEWLMHRINALQREDERLQLQIDRLEGHPAKSYTED